MNLRYFFTSLALSIPFWWGVNLFQNDLEDFFIWQAVGDDQNVFLARAGVEPIKIFKPVRNPEAEDLSAASFSAKSMLAAEMSIEGNYRVIFQKNPDEALPIASISKLMAANVAFKSLDLLKPVEVSKQAVAQEEAAGKLKEGEVFLAHDLLYVALIESSNDAAYALAEQIGVEEFLDKMNESAKELGLVNTYFANPSGVDPDVPGQPQNVSTARDLAKFAQYLLREEPGILEILNFDSIDLYQPDGNFHHSLNNTNELVGTIPRLVGGKTGWTPLAKGCLILIQKKAGGDGFFVYVILGSEDRFGEMKRLVEWTNAAWNQ